ncbi:hypothetical protein [Sorangium sp. So ce1389]|uniref:hypothetical protein n=1 Tax=Sorangium sp. So ce1389 TaxID=3133336 RepID=UPI003F6097A3
MQRALDSAVLLLLIATTQSCAAPQRNPREDVMLSSTSSEVRERHRAVVRVAREQEHGRGGRSAKGGAARRVSPRATSAPLSPQARVRVASDRSARRTGRRMVTHG